tara:strand:- start:133 stop:588 length:456 start_codon:yes stop_codon:yes gene_type:complete
MPDSRVSRVLDAIKGKIAQDFSLKTSQLDMSNRCILGSIDAPPSVPYASVFFVDFQSEHGPTLGRYRATPRFEAYLFVGGASIDERLKQTINLCSDVIEALTTDRFLGLGSGFIDDVLCNFTAVEGDKFGLNDIGIGYIEISTPFQSTTGS